MAVDLDVLGTTGLRRFGGHIDEEFLRRLQGRRAIKVYREMRDNDPIIGGILFAIDSLVRGVEWPVKAAGPDEESQKWAEFLRGSLDDMSITWTETVSEILSMLVFGWCYMEKVWKIRRGPSKDPRFRSKFTDGMIGIRKLEIRAQESLEQWQFDEEGGIEGMWQIPVDKPHRIFIPIEKAVLYRTRVHKNNPEGRSILRNAYRPWYFLKRIQEFEAIGIERNLAGIPMMRVPIQILDRNANTADSNLRADLEKLGQELRYDERGFILFPAAKDSQGRDTGYDFELMGPSGRKTVDTDPVIQRWERRIAASVLADFITSTDVVGAYASLKAKHQFFGVALTSLLDTLAVTTNRFVVNPLMQMNGAPQEAWPTLEHGDIGKPEITEISEFVAKLAPLGFLSPDEETEQRLRQIGDLPLDDGLSKPTNIQVTKSAPTDIDEAFKIIATVKQHGLPPEVAVEMLQWSGVRTKEQAEGLIKSLNGAM